MDANTCVASRKNTTLNRLLHIPKITPNLWASSLANHKPPMSKKSVKVAVIGSGLTGLTAAYLLTGPLQNDNLQFEVHLYEKVYPFVACVALVY